MYKCDYCQRDLSTSLRIKCAVCPDFDLCLDCFSVGAEKKPHKNDHSYRVVDSLSFPVYTPDWGADEEMLLLEGVELYGLGNWSRVGKHVGKPEEECKNHYFSVYVDVDTFPNPKKAPEMKHLDIKKLIENRRREGARRIALVRAGVLQKKDSYRDLNLMNSTLQATQSTGEARQKGKDVKNTPLMPTEQRPSASEGAVTNEKIASPGGNMASLGLCSPNNVTSKVANKSIAEKSPTATLGSTESAHQVVVSEAQQTGYNVKRQEFDPEYDHDAEAIIADLDFPDGEPEETTAKKLRLIEIYNRRLDERERRKSFVLSRGLVNVKRQQFVDRRRSVSDREYVGRLRVIARYLPQLQWNALAEGLIIEGRLRARIAELQKYRDLGMRSFDQVESWEAVESLKKKEVPPASQPGRSKLQRIPVSETALESELVGLGFDHAAGKCHAQHSRILDGCGPSGMDSWRLKRGVLLDVASLPDIEPLTAKERQLCANERYLPSQYLAIKAESLAKQESQGGVSRSDVENLPFLVGKDRAARLHEFFLEQGWISLPSHGARRNKV